MRSGEGAHRVELDFFEPLEPRYDLGATIALAAAVTTKSGRDLAGAAFEIRQGEAVVARGVLPGIERFDPESDGYDPRNGAVDERDCARIAFKAPREIGAFEWTLVLPAQEIDGIAHAAASLAFSFTTGEHKTSLAVWDVPSPVVVGEQFSVKVGAKCGACCVLTGRAIELRDETGGVIAAGLLGDAPWPGTDGLYWAQLQATASAEQGLRHCTAAFAARDLELPHEGASASFSYMAVAPGRHQVCVTLVERGTRAPIVEAQVRLGFHRGATDATGVARFTAPAGKQRLFIWKAGFLAPEQTIDVNCDLELAVEAEALPEEDPYARWQG